MIIPRYSCSAALRAVARRTFTSSTRLQRIRKLPDFADSSSEELAVLLQNVRNVRLVEAHLKKSELHTIRSPKLAPRLENEPQYAQIGDETLRLEPRNMPSTVPGPRSAFGSLVSMSSTREDWDNLETLLEGMKNAGYEMPRRPFHEQDINKLEKFVRKGIEAGYPDVILRCLQRAEATGLSLKHEYILLRFMSGIRALADEGESESLEKALRFAEQVPDLLEAKDHCGSRKIEKGDPRTMAYVVAVPLELAAARALKPEGWDAEGGRVAMYAERLLAIIKEHGIHDPPLRHNPERKIEKYTPQTPALRRRIHTWLGLSLSSRFLGQAMPERKLAEKTMKELGQEIESSPVYKSGTLYSDIQGLHKAYRKESSRSR